MARLSVAAFSLALVTIARGAVGQEAPIAFTPGQEWTIRAEPPSPIKVVIGRVEPFGNGVAVSVTLLDVPCPKGAGCTTTTVAHAPFDARALEKSVDRLIAKDVPVAPDFEQGYANWKEANGGVFTVGVAEIPDIIFQTIRHGSVKPQQ